MSLLTPNPVSLGDGGPLWEIAVLDPQIYRDTRWCSNCGGPRVVIEIFEFDNRRLVACQGCGEEKVVLLDRTNSEAA